MRLLWPPDPRRWARALPVAVLVFSVGVSVFGERGVLGNRDLHARIDAEGQAAARDQVRVGELREDIRALREEPEALERRAREDLGLVREGEIVFDFGRRASPGLATPAAPRPVVEARDEAGRTPARPGARPDPRPAPGPPGEAGTAGSRGTAPTPP